MPDEKKVMDDSEEKLSIGNMIGMKSTKVLECFKREIPPAIMVTEKEKEIWNIKSLNFNMKPVCEPSPFLEMFMKNSEQQFHKNLETMRLNIREVNNKTENCIRTACETFKYTLRDTENTIEEWKTFVSSGEVPLTPIMMSKHEILNLTALQDILNKRKEAIEDFYNNLLSIENLRLKENVCILRNSNVMLKRLAVRKPSEIREILEMEILKINQLVMNNVRYYEDIKLNFNLQGEKLRSSFKDYVDKCQKKFADNFLDALLKKIKEVNLDKEFFDSDEGKKALESLHATREMISHLIKQQSGHVQYTKEDADMWIKKIQKAARELDETAKMVISLYKKITYCLFQGRVSALEKFQTEYMGIISSKSSEETAVLQSLQKRVSMPILEKEQQHEHEVTEIETQWKELMDDMHNALQGTFSFLYDSSYIWDRHFTRTKEAKSIINMKLIATIADNSIDEMELERELNVGIDSLRQEPTEEKLKNTLNKVYGLLEQIEEQYGKHFAELKSIMKKYNSITEAEIKLLHEEIEKFLSVYPSEYYNDYFVRRQEQLSTTAGEKYGDTKVESAQSRLPQELRKCQYQADALRNWKLGLREAIVFYRVVCNKEIERNMKRWMDKQCNSLTRQFEAKLTVHRGRYHRVKTEIHDLRLSELESHIQRFESHVLGVQQQMTEIDQNSQDFLNDLNTNVLPEFICTVNDLEDKGRTCVSTIEVCALIVKAENMYTKLTQNLDSRLQDFLNETVNKIVWIEKSNNNFIKSMKFFFNEGNYHPEEVRVLSAELDALTEDVERKGKSLRRNVTDNQANVVRTMKVTSEKLLQGFRSTYEDIHFAEKVTLAIMRVRDFIKKEVQYMKYNRKQLTLKVDHLIKDMPETGGTDLLKFVKESWQSLLHAAEQHYMYIVQPLPTNSNSKLAGLQFLGFDGIIKKPIYAKGHNSKSFVDLLFDNANPPIAGDTFLEKVCHCMWEVFLTLQDASTDFYKVRKGTPLPKMDIVKPSFGGFMEDMLIRFKYYHLQSEEVWVEEVHEYLSLLQRIKQACNTFSEQSVRKFHSNRMNAVSAAHTIFAQKMDRLDTNHSARRRVLSKKLKPHHGYPGNKLLLEQLMQELKDGNSTMKNETDDNVKQYKEYLEERRNAYRSDSQGLRFTLERLLDTLFVSSRLTDNLKGQVEEVVQGVDTRSIFPSALSSIKKSARKKLNGNETDILAPKISRMKRRGETGNDESGASLYSAMTQESDIDKVPRMYRLSIEQNGKNVNVIPKQTKGIPNSASVEERRLDQKISDIPNVKVSIEGESEESEMVPCDVASSIAISEEEFVKYVAKCELMALKHVSMCNEEGKIWLKLFKKHAQKVKELYTVRND